MNIPLWMYLKIHYPQKFKEFSKICSKEWYQNNKEYRKLYMRDYRAKKKASNQGKEATA